MNGQNNCKKINLKDISFFKKIIDIKCPIIFTEQEHEGSYNAKGNLPPPLNLPRLAQRCSRRSG